MSLTFERMKQLIQTDFFDIDQIKEIRDCLAQHKPIVLSHLSHEQLRTLANLEIVTE